MSTIDDNLVVRINRDIIPDKKGIFSLAQFYQFLIKRQCRVIVAFMEFHVDSGEPLIDPKPWYSLRESGIFAVVPLHRGTRGIPAEIFFRHIQTLWILNLFKGNGNITHTDFIAIVDSRCAA